MTTQSFDFQPPMNMNAIRSSIIQRIKQRNEKTCLDNGLPSPPIEDYENKLPSEQVMNALMELSEDSVMLPPMDLKLDTDSIRERIRSLQEEKHKLFQMMKGLLQPTERPISRYSNHTK